MAPGPLPCAVNDVCPVLVWSHTVAGLSWQESVSDNTQLYTVVRGGDAFSSTSSSCRTDLISVQTKSVFSYFSSSSRFQMIYSCCWMMNWVITSPLCVPSDWAFVHYKMDLTSWTCSPPEVSLTSTLLLPLTHGLVASDGHWGVNPLLLQALATVKSDVTHTPVTENAQYIHMCWESVCVICFDGSNAVEVKILNKFNLGRPGRLAEKHKCKVWFQQETFVLHHTPLSLFPCFLSLYFTVSHPITARFPKNVYIWK